MKYVLLLSLFTIGCASNPNKVEMFKEIYLDKRQAAGGDEYLGLNKDQELIIQRKTIVAEEYRRTKNDVYALEARVYGVKEYGSVGLYGVYKQCMIDLADPDKGGNGKLNWIEPRDFVTKEEKKIKIGLEGDMVVGLEEEYYKDRIQKFKQWNLILEKREEDLEEKIVVCNLKKKVQVAGGK